MKCSKAVLNEQNKLIHYMESNMQGKIAYIPCQLQEMEVINFGDVLVVNSNLPSDTFNTTYGGQITQEHARLVYEFYSSRSLPMAWWIGPSSQSPECELILQQSGFKQVEYDVGMACDLTTVSLDYTLPSSLEIKMCTEPQSISDFGAVLSSVFTPEDLFVKNFYNQLAELDAEKISALHLFIGYEQEKPVAISGLFLSECAGFFDVATRPAHQKKGYGSALFYTAIKHARALGYEIGVLQASPEGLGIYKRFGFFEVCDFNVWSN